MISPSAIIDTGALIGANTKVWAFSHICKNAKIGSNCSIGEGVHIGPNVIVGDNCKIQNHSLIYEGVTIEDHVFIGPNVVTTNDPYPRAFGDWSDRFKKTLIKRGVGIGANSTILCGLILEEFCMIAAGSVVTDHVMRQSLVKGNPARHIRFMADTEKSPFSPAFRLEDGSESLERLTAQILPCEPPITGKL